MESLDPVAQVRELWRAWAGGGVEALLAHVDDDAEWAPHAEGRVLRGADELRAFWADVAARGERRRRPCTGSSATATPWSRAAPCASSATGT